MPANPGNTTVTPAEGSGDCHFGRHHIFRPVSHIGPEEFLEFFPAQIRKITSQVIVTAPVEDNTVQVGIGCKVFQHIKEKLLCPGMKGVKKPGAVIIDIQGIHDTVGGKLHRGPVALALIAEQHSVFTDTGYLPSDHGIYRGIYPEPQFMSFIYKSLQIIPGGRAFYTLKTSAYPGSHKGGLRGYTTLEKNIPGGSPDIDDHIGKTGFFGLGQVAYNLAAIVREIRKLAAASIHSTTGFCAVLSCSSSGQ